MIEDTTLPHTTGQPQGVGIRALFASVAAEWEGRPHRLPEVIEQVEAIASKLKEWGWGEDIERDELMHATIGYSRVVVSYECCEWLPFDLVPDWEDDLYCWLMDEDAWHEARDNGDSIQVLAERLRSEGNGEAMAPNPNPSNAESAP